MSGRWKRNLLLIPGIGAALLPKLVCPACWPAYVALLSSVGLGFLLSTAYLFPLTVVFLMLTVITLGFRAGRRRGFGPLVLGICGAVGVLVSKFLLDLNVGTYAAVGLLIFASLWNSWPQKRSLTLIETERNTATKL